MALQIVWSVLAKIDRKEILDYWFKRNGNKNYSRKLAHQFRKDTRHLAQHPYLGKPTDFENTRVIISGNYLIFYQISQDKIEIIAIIDGRRNYQSE